MVQYEEYCISLATAARNSVGLEVLQWLYFIYKFDRKVIINDDTLTLKFAAENNQLPTLEWLNSTFNLTRQDCLDVKNYTTSKEILLWLRNNFDL
jgi:hypothetical protein